MNTDNQVRDPDIGSVYQPPQSNSLPTDISTSTQTYYVVSKKKFFILFFMTVSLFSYYWFWKNWALYKNQHNLNIWPIARTIFNVFYAYSLFKNIHDDAQAVSSVKLLNLPVLAGVYVINLIAMNIVDEFIPEYPMAPGMLAYFVSISITAWVLWQVQKQSNIASSDVEGTQNSKLTPVNYVIVVIGLLFWLVTLGAIGIELFEGS